jgi:RNA polymerase sigma-70 factor (ECF subfamily)
MTDDELVSRLAGGDERALRALYQRHVRPVYALVLRMLQDNEAAEEVVQDSFLRVWRRASDFDPVRSSFRTWLLSIAHRLAVDELRRRRARPVSADRYAGDAPATRDESRAGDPAMDPQSAAEAEEIHAAVRAALGALPSVQRAAIELAYFGGLTQGEIAEATGMPLGTIKSRIRMGMLALQMELEDRGYGPTGWEQLDG